MTKVDATIKKGKIVIIVDGKKYKTTQKVTKDDTEASIKTKLTMAIGQFKMSAPSNVISAATPELNKNKGALVKKLYNLAQKETGKTGKQKTEKTGKEKEKKGKKEKKEKATKEAVPSKGKTFTISISSSIITKALNKILKKGEKEIRKELELLAGSYSELKKYLEENASAVTAEIFNLLYENKDFQMYLNSEVIGDHPEYGELLEYMSGNKKGLTKSSELIELANNAIRNYLKFVIKDNKDLAEEIEHLGGIGTGPMDAELLFSSMLYLRRDKKSDSPVLKLELVEAVEVVEPPKETVTQPEGESVKAPAQPVDWTKQTNMLSHSIASGDVDKVELPENYPIKDLIDSLHTELVTDDAYIKFVKNKKGFKGLLSPTVKLDKPKKQRLFVISVQRYLKSNIEKNDQFAKDLKAAGIDTKIVETGELNLELLKMVTMLKWRQKNPKAPTWGQKVKKPEPAKQKKTYKYNF